MHPWVKSDKPGRCTICGMELTPVYEGETILKVNLKADNGTKIGKRELPAKLQVQACDDKVCYAPGVIRFSIPVDVQ